MSVSNIGGSLASQIAGSLNRAPAAAPAAGAKREPSQFWVNIGIKIPGGNEDGSDLVISLPNGLPLDDMKEVTVKGSNPQWVGMQQAKNALLNVIKTKAGALAPGERLAMPELVVEVYRAKGEQAATSEGATSLIQGVFAAFENTGTDG